MKPIELLSDIETTLRDISKEQVREAKSVTEGLALSCFIVRKPLLIAPRELRTAAMRELRQAAARGAARQFLDRQAQNDPKGSAIDHSNEQQHKGGRER